MSGIACGCASEVCAVMGCRRVAEIRRQHAGVHGTIPLVPLIPHLTPPLTTEDVRRIVREEIAKALGGQS